MSRRFQSLWNMTGMTSAPLLRCLSNVVYETFTPHLAALVLIEIFRKYPLPFYVEVVDGVIKFHWQTGEYNEAKSQLNFINAILFNFAEVAVSFTLGKALFTELCYIYIMPTTIAIVFIVWLYKHQICTSRMLGDHRLKNILDLLNGPHKFWLIDMYLHVTCLYMIREIHFM